MNPKDSSKKLLELLLKQKQEKREVVISQGISDLIEKLDGDVNDLRGFPGEKGETGEKGEKGEVGKDGKPGKNGTDGKNGRDGQDGVNGIDGIDGLNGMDGLNGCDGSPDTADDIRNKLELLPTGEKLSIDAIDGQKTFNDSMIYKLNIAIESLDNHRVFGIKLNGQRKPQANQINFIGPGIVITHDGEQGVNVDLTGLSTGGGTPSIGGGITNGTLGSVLFVSPTATIGQDNNNFYFQDNNTTPTILATNTLTALSVDTGGDFTGTDSINTYGQYDAYLPNSAITNSLAGLNTDGAVPGYSTSSSRGTGQVPIQLQTGDMIGGYFGFGSQGAISPTYQNIGGMAIATTGSTTNNLGGELRFYTKGDGGALALGMTLSNAGHLTVEGVTSTGATGTGAIVFATSPTFNGTPNATAFRITTLSGGTGIATAMVIQSTSGVGTSDSITFKTGSQVTAMAINTTQGVSLTSLTTGGLVKSAVTTGLLSNATAGTDYIASVNTDTTLTGFGTTASPLGINLTTANSWSAAISAPSFIGNAGASTAIIFDSSNTQSSSNFWAIQTGIGASLATARYLFGGATGINIRTAIGSGSSGSVINTNSNYTAAIVAGNGFTGPASGTNAWANSLTVQGIGTYIPGAANILQNTAVLYLGTPSTAGSVGNYGLYISSGNSYLGDSIQIAKTITPSGTNGAQTINNPAGSVNFAAGAGSLIVTNSLVSATSIIVATVATNDALMMSVSIIASTGSFTLVPNSAPSGATRVNFLVIN